MRDRGTCLAHLLPNLQLLAPVATAITFLSPSHLILSPMGRLYAHFTELKTEAGPEDVLAQSHDPSEVKSARFNT